MTANSGETLEIFINAKNYGSESAENVVATLNSNNGYVSIYQDWSQVNLGAIGSGETVIGGGPVCCIINKWHT